MASISVLPLTQTAFDKTEARHFLPTNVLKVSDTEDLKELRQILHQGVDDLLEELEIHERKLPSLKPCTPDDVFAAPVGVLARRNIIRACEKITSLVQGPMWWMMQSTGGSSFPAVLNTALELKLHYFISWDREVPTKVIDLASETGGSQELIYRILRYLTQRFVFEEVVPGHFAHNANSSILKVPGIEALMGTCSDDVLRANSALPSLMKEIGFQIPETNTPCAFSKAFNTQLSMFDYLYQKEPDRAQRFAKAMTPWMTFSYLDSSALFPFKHLQPGTLIVDVGGGSGHVSVQIAKSNPHLKFIVQDFEEPISIGKLNHENSGLAIEWQVHNAFDPQPVEGADIYLLRRLLHDHSDTDAAKILRAVKDAMGSESRILIEDMIVPDLYGEESEWFINHADIVMLSCLNAKERSLAQWNALIKQADERLEIVKVWTEDCTTAGFSAIVEVKLGS